MALRREAAHKQRDTIRSPQRALVAFIKMARVPFGGRGCAAGSEVWLWVACVSSAEP